MDEHDKIRRNLVVFSAGVLLVAWLNVPVQGVLQDAFKVKQEIPAFRTWFAAAVVLVYLSLRYRFSSESSKLINGAKRLYQGSKFDGVSKLLDDVSFDSDRAPKYFLDAEYKDVRERFLDVAGDDRKGVHLAPSIESQEGWHGVIQVQAVRTGRGGSQTFGDYSLPYKLTGTRRATVQLRALYYSWVYSEVSINYVAPVVLAALAGGVIVWRLWAVF